MIKNIPVTFKFGQCHYRTLEQAFYTAAHRVTVWDDSVELDDGVYFADADAKDVLEHPEDYDKVTFSINHETLTLTTRVW